MADLQKKLLNKRLRKNRIRARVNGTADRPRLTVFISNKHVSAQIIDDTKGITIVSATTVGTKLAGSMTELAAKVGSNMFLRFLNSKILFSFPEILIANFIQIGRAHV